MKKIKVKLTKFLYKENSKNPVCRLQKDVKLPKDLLQKGLCLCSLTRLPVDLVVEKVIYDAHTKIVHVLLEAKETTSENFEETYGTDWKCDKLSSDDDIKLNRLRAYQ